ncbi:hypothetical protein TNCV_3332481 [Trichonephila clavipes]|nr:hypothetical protein TNCV_3332481 [Trichonephila clavipes]
MNKGVREGDAPPFWKLRSTCKEVGTHRRKFRPCRGWNHHKHLRRGVNSNNFNSNDITCEEVKSHSGIEAFFNYWIYRTCEQQKEPEKKKRTRRLSCSDNPSPMKSKYRRFSFGLCGRTAADSVQSEWLPLWHAAKKPKPQSRAQAQLSESRTETEKL